VLTVVGGDCSVEIAPVSYLNRRYAGDLALVWLDAHADLNTPASSPSGTLHGMPLRVLLGDGDSDILGQAFSKLDPRQVVLAGVRAFDPPERAYVEAQGLMHLTADAFARDPDELIGAIRARGYRHIYVHLDFDVLDPTTFTSTEWPTPGGLTPDALGRVLVALQGAFDVVGLGATEYFPQRDEDLQTAYTLLLTAAPR
jgi:arginase